jgi:hypothetical protein
MANFSLRIVPVGGVTLLRVCVCSLDSMLGSPSGKRKHFPNRAAPAPWKGSEQTGIAVVQYTS